MGRFATSIAASATHADNLPVVLPKVSLLDALLPRTLTPSVTSKKTPSESKKVSLSIFVQFTSPHPHCHMRDGECYIILLVVALAFLLTFSATTRPTCFNYSPSALLRDLKYILSTLTLGSLSTQKLLYRSPLLATAKSSATREDALSWSDIEAASSATSPSHSRT